MRAVLPEDLSAATEVELKRVAADADYVRTEALFELRRRETSGATAERERRLAAMSPAARKTVEWLSRPNRVAIAAGAITILIMVGGGISECGSVTVNTVGTTQRVIRDLDEVMKDHPQSTKPQTEAADRALGL